MQSIAVLLAAYNGQEWLEQQLTSVVNQVCVKTHIFISIDYSTDETFNLCKSLASLHTNITILPYGLVYGGAGANFIRLISDCPLKNYDYIAFCDQDDIWHLNKLFFSIALIKNTKADAYSSNVNAFWPNGKTYVICKSQTQVQWDYLFESAGPGCTFVLTKRLALQLQTFVLDQSSEMKSVWLHDWFIYAFARANGYTWSIDPQPTMQYRQHTNNQVGVNIGLKALMHRAKFILSGQWFRQVAIIVTLVGKKDSAFVKGWYPFSRLGFFKLAFQAHKCRRRIGDQVWFFFICLLMSLAGKDF
jgi:rhamnosyltransferase